MGRTIDDNRLIKQGGQFLIGTSEKKDRNIFFLGTSARSTIHITNVCNVIIHCTIIYLF